MTSCSPWNRSLSLQRWESLSPAVCRVHQHTVDPLGCLLTDNIIIRLMKQPRNGEGYKLYLRWRALPFLRNNFEIQRVFFLLNSESSRLKITEKETLLAGKSLSKGNSPLTLFNVAHYFHESGRSLCAFRHLRKTIWGLIYMVLYYVVDSRYCHITFNK